MVLLVSDRAQARIKRAETGLGCRSIPALFPLLQELVKSYAWAMVGRLRQARQALRHAQERLRTGEASQPNGAETPQAQAVVEASAAEGQRWESVHSVYRQPLETLSRLVQPGHLCDAKRQTAAEVERHLSGAIRAIEVLVDTHGLPVKKPALVKVRTQRAGLAALVDLWWQRVWQEVQPQVALTPAWTQGIAEVLLPRRSWQEQRARTRCPRRQATLAEAWEAVQTACERHPITQQLAPTVCAGWETGAREHGTAFQRASSAVEGRNGSWSQMHHNHRGVPKGRDKVWTVLHNFDGRAAEGTTPAARFFRRDFPDLFETVLSYINDLPRPRKRHQAIALSG